MSLNITPPASTSAALAAQITDETGSGSIVFATSPTLVTPVLGTPSSGDVRNCTAAIDATAGVLSAADHTTLTSLSGFTTGVAPTTPVGVLFMANKTGVDLKTNATTDIFTVPNGKTFVLLASYAIPTAVTSGAAVTFAYKIVESGGSAAMSTNTVATSAAPATTKTWAQNNTTPGSSPLTNCAAAAKVQITITTGFTTSTSVTGTVWVTGFYF